MPDTLHAWQYSLEARHAQSAPPHPSGCSVLVTLKSAGGHSRCVGGGGQHWVRFFARGSAVFWGKGRIWGKGRQEEGEGAQW